MSKGLKGIPKERLAKEVRHFLYRNDFALCAKEQLKIRVKDVGAVVPLDVSNRPAQQAYLASTMTQLKEEGFARQIWFKNRQQGGSTLAAALLFWRCVFNKNTNALVVAHDKTTAQELFVMIQTYYQNLSPDFRPMVKHDTLDGLVFDNPDATDRLTNPGLGCRLSIATARNIHSGAGRTIHAGVLSEAARYEKPEELQSAIFDAVPLKSNSIIIIESTAFYNPVTSWFKTMCEDVQKSKGYTPWRFTFKGWQADPDCKMMLRDDEVIDLTKDEFQIVRQFGLTPENIKWMRYKVAEYKGDMDLFRCSYPLTFEEAWIIPGTNLLSSETLKGLRAQVRPPIFQGDVHAFNPAAGGWFSSEAEGPLKIWEWPEAGEQYDAGVDVCAGVGKTYTVVTILRRRDKCQVAEWRNNTITPGDPLVNVLKWLGLAYNTAQIAVESNPGNPGYYTNAELGKVYPNMFIWKNYSKVANKILTKDTGWDTTPNSKVFLVATMIDWLAGGKTTVRSETLWGELMTFRKYSDRHYEAIPGALDDCVLSYGIALRASIDETFEGWGMPAPEIKTVAPPLDPAYYDRNWDRVVRQNSSQDGFDRASEEMEAWGD